MTEAPDPFEEYDTGVSVSEVVGEHTFEDVLYTGDGSEDVAQVKEKIAEQEMGEYPRVAFESNPETQFEIGAEYLSVVFFSYKITGGLGWHTAFRAAVERDEFDVDFEADYVSGNLSITVNRSE